MFPVRYMTDSWFCIAQANNVKNGRIVKELERTAFLVFRQYLAETDMGGQQIGMYLEEAVMNRKEWTTGCQKPYNSWTTIHSGVIYKTRIFVLMLLKILFSIFMVNCLDLLPTIQRQMPNFKSLDLSFVHHNGNGKAYLGTENISHFLHSSVSLTKVGLPSGQI